MTPVVLDTQRLKLKQVQDEDADIVFRALSHPEVIRYYGVSYATPEAAQDQMRWYASLHQNDTGIWWIIEDKITGEKLGGCGFNNLSKEHRKTELGYWLLPEFQGRGYMTEALHCAIQFALENKNMHRIEAMIEPPNIQSKKLLGKLGFVFEGCMRDCEIKNGVFISLEIYALIHS